jgi:2-methylcitrate dehydratase
MDWLSRMTASGRLTHTGPPLTMRTLLIAVIKAYEIQGCYQMRNAFNAYGIDHVVLVKLASAAVVSWLLGLTEEQTMACISHVWMDGQPTRVYRARDNTIPRKGWAAGDAARRAVQLALYVQAGQPGSRGALSSKPWGFWARTFGDAGFQFARPFGTWTIQNVLFKAMPVEGHAVSAVEAVLLQMDRFKAKGLSIPAQDIKQIDLRTTAAADLIINKRGPLRNAADRDHCIQYAVALACLKGSAPEAADYLDTSPWATNDDLKCLMERITVSPDPELTRDYLDIDKKSIGTGVTVHLKDQSVLPEILVEYPMGHARNPETNASVEDKFSQNMARMFLKTEIAQIARAVHRPDLPVSNFVDLLARPASQPKL